MPAEEARGPLAGADSATTQVHHRLRWPGLARAAAAVQQLAAVGEGPEGALHRRGSERHLSQRVLMSYQVNRNQFITGSSHGLKLGGMYKYNKYKESGQYFLVDSFLHITKQYFQSLKWLTICSRLAPSLATQRSDLRAD